MSHGPPRLDRAPQPSTRPLVGCTALRFRVRSATGRTRSAENRKHELGQANGRLHREQATRRHTLFLSSSAVKNDKTSSACRAVERPTSAAALCLYGRLWLASCNRHFDAHPSSVARFHARCILTSSIAPSARAHTAAQPRCQRRAPIHHCCCAQTHSALAAGGGSISVASRCIAHGRADGQPPIVTSTASSRATHVTHRPAPGESVKALNVSSTTHRRSGRRSISTSQRCALHHPNEVLERQPPPSHGRSRASGCAFRERCGRRA